MNSLCKNVQGIFFLLLIASLASANVELPTVFSDNMVLQQKSQVGIWGKAAPWKTVTIRPSWSGKNVTIKADAQGNWKTKIATPVYGGPYTIRISEGNTITLKNVLIGEVWLCSGQSNMEMPLAGWGKVDNYQQEIDKARYPQIRLLQAIHVTSNQPITSLKIRNTGWDVCSPETVAEFSSVAYFFAREIYEKTKIPIGLIHSSWGGTIAEAWTSYETLSTLPDFAEAAKRIRETPEATQTGNAGQKLKDWENGLITKDKGYESGQPVWAKADWNTTSWKLMNLPTTWENSGMDGFDGVVWFRKNINLSDDWLSGDLKLSLSTIDDDDITFFNDVQVGSTSGWNAERVYNIPASLLRKGPNTIAVRVMDSGGGGGLYGEAKSMFVKKATGEAISLAGPWLYQPSFSLKDYPARPDQASNPNRPTVLYNAMLNPIINYTIRGAIWYQGESNAGRAYQYRELFPAMITDWRKKFAVGDFPFYFVQLANFMKRDADPGASSWAELREAQLMTTSLKNTGMAVSIDIGDAVDIHPKNKQDVGKRLAYIGLNKVYGMKNEYSGPLYQSQKVVGNTIVLRFTHADGMYAKGDALKGFSIAGSDKKFYWAKASVRGNEIVVSAPEVSAPVAVRYGWANNPEVNLYNSAQLPASPFRTDTWKETTFGKK